MAERIEAIPQPNGGQIERNRILKREYQLPQMVNPQIGSCLLSSEGILVVSIPWIQLE